jgi:hypothetical protein
LTLIFTCCRCQSVVAKIITLTNFVAPEPKVSHHVHKSPPPALILSQMNQLHTPWANLPKINSDSILPSTPWSFERSLSFRLSHQNLVHFSFSSNACHMCRPPHSLRFDVPNGIWWWFQNMKLFSMQFPPFSSYFISLRSDILLRTLFSNTLSLCYSLNVRDQVSRPCKTADRLMVLYILTLRPTFLKNKRENKRLWIEW